jgi:hypothetical protein
VKTRESSKKSLNPLFLPNVVRQWPAVKAEERKAVNSIEEKTGRPAERFTRMDGNLLGPYESSPLFLRFAFLHVLG